MVSKEMLIERLEMRANGVAPRIYARSSVLCFCLCGTPYSAITIGTLFIYDLRSRRVYGDEDQSHQSYAACRLGGLARVSGRATGSVGPSWLLLSDPSAPGDKNLRRKILDPFKFAKVPKSEKYENGVFFPIKL
jgi:hypothetical protein